MLKLSTEIVQGHFETARIKVGAYAKEGDRAYLTGILDALEAVLVHQLCREVPLLEAAAEAKAQPIEPDRWHWWRHTWPAWGEVQSCPGHNMLTEQTGRVEYQDRWCTQCNAMSRRFIR